MMGNSTSDENQDDEENQIMIKKRRVRDSRLYIEIRPNQWPIVYSHKYNIGFFGIEKLHPFDSKKWGNVFKILKEAEMLTEESVIEPIEATKEDLLGGGFCVYADITLALQFLFLENRIKSAMIVDLDAHQGNGHERDFANDSRVYILDMFNKGIYPHDSEARRHISRSVPLKHYTEDREYLQKLSTELNTALGEFSADLIVYNAGTDCLIGDPLGALSITSEGIVQRDQIVFELARQAATPIVMLTSGGYTHVSAQVISDSILNLRAKNLIQLN